MFSVLAATGLVAGFLALEARAQVVVQATCSISTDQWTFNKEGQSPCGVSARLQAVCHDGDFRISPLGPGQFYTGPKARQSDQCVCSSVTYSLVSACAVCQGGVPLPWSTWAFNCSQSDISTTGLPKGIPKGTSVPTWAFLDVVAGNEWNITGSLAEANLQHADIVETNDDGTPKGSPISSVSPTPTESTSSGGGGNGSGKNGNGNGGGRNGKDDGGQAGNNTGTASKSSNMAPIIGGVVGGVGGLAVIGALAFLLLRRRRRHPRSEPLVTPQNYENKPDFSRPAPAGSPLPTVVPYQVNGTPPVVQSTGKGYVPYPSPPPPPPQYAPQPALTPIPPSGHDLQYGTEDQYVQDRPQSMTYFPNPYGSPSSPNALNSAPSPQLYQQTGPIPYASQQPGMRYSGAAEV